MKKILFICLAAVFLVGCGEQQNLSVETTTIQESTNSEEQSTESDDYFESFQQPSSDSIQLSLTNGISCTLALPSNATVNMTESSSLVETIFNNAYVVFELGDNVDDMKTFTENELTRDRERDGENYSEELSFSLSEQNVSDKTVYFARHSTKDGTINCWYGIIPLEEGCILVTYEVSPNVQIPANEEVLSTILAVVK